MKCPYCGHNRSRVLDTRDTGDAIRRRRLCLNCQKRFTTYEQVSVAVHVVKSDGRREAFDRIKLLNGIRMACAKRPIAMTELEGIVEQIEEYVYNSGQAEIPSEVIGNMVLDRLQEIDPVAYIRFATVYLELPDLDAVQAVIENLVGHSR